MPYDPFKKSFKPAVKATAHCVTYCKLDVCAYHEGPATPGSDAIKCSHPHKSQHLNQVPCPLYRLDWQRQMKQGGRK